MNDETIILYTDGSCLNNPGAGGWAALLLFKSHRKEIVGGAKNTTNNRMELTAAINGLSAVKKNLPIILYCDSRYVIDGIEKWCINWKKNNWKNSQKKMVENRDLWEQLDALNQKHVVQWQWVKAHHINEHNNYVDELARNVAQKFKD